MIDAFATWSHYLAYVAPVYNALPIECQGDFYVDREEMRCLALDRYGIEARLASPCVPGPPVIVAGHQDMASCHSDRRFIYLEHGAGQSYIGIDSASYSGGGNRQHVILFLTLNEQTAERERVRYPDTPVEIIGSPRLDDLCRVSDQRERSTITIAFAFHANIKICMETRATYHHWWPALKALHASGAYRILGHGHPREWRKLRSWYDKAGIETASDFAEVCARADLLCVDNSSTGPEFAAATDRPVLWLNAPTYRRELNHGGRFWDWPKGQVSCDDPEHLGQRIALALADIHETRNARQLMVDEIYPPWTRGRAAELGAQAITRMLVNA